MTLHKLLPYCFYPITWVILLLGLALWQIRRARPGKAARSLLLALLLLSATASPTVAKFFWNSLESQYPALPLDQLPTAEAIVLLTGGIDLPAPPRVRPDLNEAGDRVLYAAELYHAGKAPLIVVTGGQVFSQPGLLSEAEYHVGFLLRAGVPRAAILLETLSENTAANARNTAEILQSRGIRNILLVTSGVHMPRSMYLFHEVGLVPVAASCDIRIAHIRGPRLLGLLPSARAFFMTESAIREWIGVLFYQARSYWR